MWSLTGSKFVDFLIAIFIAYYTAKILRGINIGRLGEDERKEFVKNCESGGRVATAYLYKSFFARSAMTGDKELKDIGIYEWEVDGKSYKRFFKFYDGEHLKGAMKVYWRDNPKKAQPEPYLGKKDFSFIKTFIITAILIFII